MSHVLVLTAAHADLGDADLRTAEAAFGTAGIQVNDLRWLAPGKAVELAFNRGATADVADLVRAALAGRAIDANVVAAGGRRKGLLVADMESTIIENEMLDELADIAGIGAQIAAITKAAMNGELDFFAAIRERVALLRGLSEGALAQSADRIRIMPGARTLVATMKANGAYCALVSGGFTWFTSRIRLELGFDEDRANLLVVEEGQLAGTVGEPILGREAKLAALEELAAVRGLDLEATIAVGDGANDLAMLGRAGFGVAYHAKPVVAAAAGIRVDHCDLTALLYLQGYREDEFVAG